MSTTMRAAVNTCYGPPDASGSPRWRPARAQPQWRGWQAPDCASWLSRTVAAGKKAACPCPGAQHRRPAWQHTHRGLGRAADEPRHCAPRQTEGDNEEQDHGEERDQDTGGHAVAPLRGAQAPRLVHRVRRRAACRSDGMKTRAHRRIGTCCQPADLIRLKHWRILWQIMCAKLMLADFRRKRDRSESGVATKRFISQLSRYHRCAEWSRKC